MNIWGQINCTSCCSDESGTSKGASEALGLQNQSRLQQKVQLCPLAVLNVR